jgi:fructokinase
MTAIYKSTQDGTMHKDAKREIVCFGEALIDFLASDREPGAPQTFIQHAGGAPANAAVAVARLGGRAQFVGMLGADMFGDFLLQSLDEAGVGTQYARRTDVAKTALAFVSLDANGERSFSFYRPPSADLLFRASDFDLACFERASIFHVCSNSLTEPDIARTTLEGMALARREGALVSIDLNLRTALWPTGTDPLPWLWQALSAADLVKLASNELDYLAAGEEDGEAQVIQRVMEKAQVLVVTDGAAPLRWYTRDSSGVLDTFHVRAVDTTAAGDAFIGGLLYQLQARGIDRERFASFAGDRMALVDSLRFAAGCGALAVTRHGAFAALPRLDEVSTLIESNPA